MKIIVWSSKRNTRLDFRLGLGLCLGTDNLQNI